MMNRKEQRLETMKKAGLDTNKFFNLNMDIPIGSKVKIEIDGVPYTFDSEDKIIKQILDSGYVYNPKTDKRWVTAQTFRMLNEKSYNHKFKCWETGWDAYLRNNFPYMYQFTMMRDEVHRLAKMENDNDPDFDKLSKFFTKDVVYQTCKDYIRKLKKFIRKQPNRKCKGVPYVKLNKYGNVFIKDLDSKVFNNLEYWADMINYCFDYQSVENALKQFMRYTCKLPKDTPKAECWKTAYKGNGAFGTLNNIIKHHNCVVRNYETGEILDRDGSLAYVDSLLDIYKPNEYWKFHELLKATIELNKFDLRKSIEAQRN